MVIKRKERKRYGEKREERKRRSEGSQQGTISVSGPPGCSPLLPTVCRLYDRAWNLIFPKLFIRLVHTDFIVSILNLGHQGTVL